MSGLFQPNVFQHPLLFQTGAGTTTPTTPPVVGGIGRGNGKKHRKTIHLPRRTVIEIGGEQFVIGTLADAQAVLAEAKKLAPQTAQHAAEKALRKRVRVRSGLVPVQPLPPTVRLLHTAPEFDVGQLWAQIDAANAAFERIYAKAWEQAMDDEEAAHILLL